MHERGDQAGSDREERKSIERKRSVTFEVDKDILEMNLDQLLLRKKGVILQQWITHVIETYPPETAKIMMRERNQFANPVGHHIQQGLTGLFDQLLQDKADPQKTASFLDRIIRIRAIQDFSPSQAMAFIFFIKQIVREIVRTETQDAVSSEDILIFDSKVDELALLGFNVYMECREKLYEIRVDEIKNRTFRLLQRADLLAEIPEQDWKLKGGIS